MNVSLDSDSKIKFAVTSNVKLSPTQLVAVRLKSFAITGLISQQIVPTAPPGLPSVGRASGAQPGLRPVAGDLENLNGTIVLSFGGQSFVGQPSVISWATNGSGQLINPSKFVDYLVFFGLVSNFLDIQLNVINSKAKDRANLTTAASIMSGLAPIAGLVPGPGTIASAGLSILGAITGAIAKSALDFYEVYYEGTKPLLDAAMPTKTIGTFEISRIPKDSAPADVTLTFDIVPFPTPPTPTPPAKPATTIKLVTIYLEAINLTSVLATASQIVFTSTFGSGNAQKPFTLPLNLNQGRLVPNLYIALDNKFLYQGAKDFGIPYSVDVAVNDVPNDTTALAPLTDGINSMAKAAPLPKDQIADVNLATKALQSSVAIAMAFLPSSKQDGSAAGMILLDDQFAALPAGVTGFIKANRTNAVESLATIPLKSDGGSAGTVTIRIVESDGPPPTPPAQGK
jgi:hypothetical protein